MDSEREAFEAWFYSGAAKDSPSALEAWPAWQARAELCEGTQHATWKLNNLHANYMAVRAECEALRKYKAAAMLMVEDAMRYHKWRSEFCKNEPTEMLVSLAEFMTPEQVDAVIDAAMGKEKA
jgi:hypothetical protein